MAKIIAELGSSCYGNIAVCVDTIHRAIEAGADFVKLQCHYGQAIDPAADHPSWFVGDRSRETRLQYLERNEWTLQEWAHIASAACGRLIVSPFSVLAAERASPFVNGWKIASGQVSNAPLIEYICQRWLQKKQPIYWSSGMAGGPPVRALSDEAADIMTAEALELLCTSAYPTEPERSQAMMLDDLAGPLGYSSHDGEIWLPIAAIVKGAAAVEIHVRPGGARYGTDVGAHAVGLQRLRDLCDARNVIQRARSADRRDVDPRISEQFLYREPPSEWPRVQASRE